MKHSTFREHISEIAIDDYSYALPQERIAQYPLAQRDRSKLLVYRDGSIETRVFHELPDLLQPNDSMVFNDTRVVHARLNFQKATGANIEIFCLEPVAPSEMNEAFASKGQILWKAMVGNAKRFKLGEVISRIVSTPNGEYTLDAEMCGKEKDTYLVRFRWSIDCTFGEILEHVGTLPIPPYLNRDTEEEDEERYQTLYAESDGSVAAPTAGLHFTPRVFDDLEKRQVQPLFVTLHVGAGTFKPVKSATMGGHEMHKERISVTLNALEKMQLSASTEGRIIAVGTTSLRTIESIYWFGVKLMVNPQRDEFFVGQWEPYELEGQAVNPAHALNAVLDWLRKKSYSHLRGYTQLLIAPGYDVKMANALVTNFHQPQSTLLLLIAAFIGDDWRRIYDHALAHDYRFLSYGDSSILFKG
ncbi:MAG: S-adenosylmethionine:tRNA ribosyltransferase-isomerase [Salibacteraceae bacterium]